MISLMLLGHTPSDLELMWGGDTPSAIHVLSLDDVEELRRATEYYSGIEGDEQLFALVARCTAGEPDTRIDAEDLLEHTRERTRSAPTTGRLAQPRYMRPLPRGQRLCYKPGVYAGLAA